MKKKESEKREYRLTAENVDVVSEQTQQILHSFGVENHNVQRLRLALEEALLNWKEHFGEQAEFSFAISARWGQPYLILELKGESFNPFGEEEQGNGFTSRLLGQMGLLPNFSYQNGCNQIRILLKKKRLNPIISLLISVGAALAVGMLGMLLPLNVRDGIYTVLLNPVYNTFTNVLSAIAGPMIFLSVAWGIYGIGDTNTLSRIGKKMLLRFLGLMLMAVSASIAILLPFVRLVFANAGLTMDAISDIIGLLLGIFPENIISPLQNGNTMQIILIAAVVGCIMLILGSSTKIVAEFIEQINSIIQYLMELVSRLVPAFIFIIILCTLWSDSISAMYKLWKPIVLSISLAFLLCTAQTLYLCARKKVKVPVFLKKVMPTFLVALTTASSSAAFGTMVSDCKQEIGVSAKIADFGIPLSIVLLKPATAIVFVTNTLYFAELYQVSVSPLWLFLAALVVTVVSMAIPPIPGGGVAGYTIVFSQLGIPAECVGMAAIVEVLLDFTTTGFDSFFRVCEITLQADSFDLLDKEKLQK